MPMMQIRPMCMFMLQWFVPVRVRMIPVLIHRRGIGPVDMLVMVEIIMRMSVGMAQSIMGVAMGVFLRYKEPGAHSHKKECDDKPCIREFMEY